MTSQDQDLAARDPEISPPHFEKPTKHTAKRKHHRNRQTFETPDRPRPITSRMCRRVGTKSFQKAAGRKTGHLTAIRSFFLWFVFAVCLLEGCPVPPGPARPQKKHPQNAGQTDWLWNRPFKFRIRNFKVRIRNCTLLIRNLKFRTIPFKLPIRSLASWARPERLASPGTSPRTSRFTLGGFDHFCKESWSSTLNRTRIHQNMEQHKVPNQSK